MRCWVWRGLYGPVVVVIVLGGTVFFGSPSVAVGSGVGASGVRAGAQPVVGAQGVVPCGGKHPVPSNMVGPEPVPGPEAAPNAEPAPNVEPAPAPGSTSLPVPESSPTPGVVAGSGGVVPGAVPGQAAPTSGAVPTPEVVPTTVSNAGPGGGCGVSVTSDPSDGVKVTVTAPPPSVAPSDRQTHREAISSLCQGIGVAMSRGLVVVLVATHLIVLAIGAVAAVWFRKVAQKMRDI